MRIITHTCSACETTVAANELEDNRVMKCPGFDCEEVLQFTDLPEDARSYFIENREQHRI